MNEDLAIIALKGFSDRAQEVNDFICLLSGNEGKNFLIDYSNPRFSNGESKVVINNTVRNKDVYIIADVGNYNCSYKIYDNENHMSPDDHYMDIIRTISAIEGKAKRITLILPLMYSSRQHRRAGRESLDCAMAFRHFESLGINNIITFDIHDPQIENTIPFGNIDNIMPTYSILKAFITNERDYIDKEKMIIISPDIGAMNRARTYAGILNLNIGLFYKQRDYTRIVNGKNPVVEHQYIGPDIKGKNILIIDDILSSGESVIDVAQKLRKRGANKIFVITTFAFFTEGFSKFDDLFKKGDIEKVYSTNATYISEELRAKEWFCEIKTTKFLSKIIVALNNHEGLEQVVFPKEKMDKLIELLKKPLSTF